MSYVCEHLPLWCVCVNQLLLLSGSSWKRYGITYVHHLFPVETTKFAGYIVRQQCTIVICNMYGSNKHNVAYLQSSLRMNRTYISNTKISP